MGKINYTQIEDYAEHLNELDKNCPPSPFEEWLEENDPNDPFNDEEWLKANAWQYE